LDVNTTRGRTSSSSKSKGKAKGKSSSSKSSKGSGWLSLEDLPQGVQKEGAKGSPVQALLEMQFNSQEKFIIWVNPNIRRVVKVVLHKQASPEEQLRAYLLAHLTCHHLQQAQQAEVCESFRELNNQCGAQLKATYGPFMEALAKNGWDVGKLYLPRPTWTAEW